MVRRSNNLCFRVQKVVRFIIIWLPSLLSLLQFLWLLLSVTYMLEYKWNLLFALINYWQVCMYISWNKLSINKNQSITLRRWYTMASSKDVSGMMKQYLCIYVYINIQILTLHLKLCWSDISIVVVRSILSKKKRRTQWSSLVKVKPNDSWVSSMPLLRGLEPLQKYTGVLKCKSSWKFHIVKKNTFHFAQNNLTVHRKMCLIDKWHFKSL